MNNLSDADLGSNAESIRKSIKYGTKFQAFKGIFIEYFEESSIHGFKYIGEQTRSALDRIIWVFAVIISIFVCCYLIGDVWEKRTNNPVIVTFNEKLTPVWEIPFPSVTICPETKTHTKIFNFTDVYNKLKALIKITENEEYYWQAIAQTCQHKYVSVGKRLILANVSDLVQAMLSAAPTFSETLSSCFWRNKLYYCVELYDPVLTEEGICFSFNSLKSEYYRTELYDARKEIFFGYRYDNVDDSEWDLEHGYNEQANEDTFPERVLEAGDKESLIVSLTDKKEDEEFLCRNSVQGFKVTLHTPGEDPVVSKNFINVPFDQSVSLTIKPSIITSDELQQYSPEKRQCYYQNEIYLRYFTVYTQTNCELEWLANKTLESCGCVKFSMPRNLSQPVCGFESMTCVDRIIRYSSTMKFRRERNSFDTSCESCNNYYCLPNCISIKYKAELEHQVPYSYSQTVKAEKRFLVDVKEHVSGIRMTQITINFKEDIFNGLKRSELYSSSDFIANCGGLLGLFMGVSILSVFEIFYFLTLRLWTNLKTRRRVQQGHSRLHQPKILKADPKNGQKVKINKNKLNQKY